MCKFPFASQQTGWLVVFLVLINCGLSHHPDRYSVFKAKHLHCTRSISNPSKSESQIRRVPGPGVRHATRQGVTDKTQVLPCRAARAPSQTDSDARRWLPAGAHGWDVSEPSLPWSPRPSLMVGGCDGAGRKWLCLCLLRDISNKPWTLQGSPWDLLYLSMLRGSADSGGAFLLCTSDPVGSREAVGLTCAAFSTLRRYLLPRGMSFPEHRN